MPVRFLIVDDIPSQQRLLANVVMFLGGESFLASNGREALHMVNHESFDIVLMDLHMPGLSGTETADQIIQSWTGLSNRPLMLAVTGDNRNESRTLCRAIGMDGFITKPYTVQYLRDVFRELLIQRYTWMDGPSQRVLSLSKLKAALIDHHGDFETQAIEARSTLSELQRDLLKMEAAVCSGKAHWVSNFAHRFGFVSLGRTMDALMYATEQGAIAPFVPLLLKQKEDFEMAYDAARSWRNHNAATSQQMMIA